MSDLYDMTPIADKDIREIFQWDRMGDVKWDILESNLRACDKILDNPDQFPNCDLEYIYNKREVIELFLLSNPRRI